MMAAIERVLLGITTREWGAIAMEAARRAGLNETEVADLRRCLENEWAIAGPRDRRAVTCRAVRRLG